jgi:hypothetical protein
MQNASRVHSGNTVRKTSPNLAGSSRKRRAREEASARTLLLAAVCFALGVGASALWFRRAAEPAPVNATQEPSGQAVSASPDNSATPADAGERKPVPAAPAQPPAPGLPADAATIEEVKHAIPNWASVTVDDGVQILRKSALNDFTVAATEMQTEVKAAEVRLSQAQNGGSEAEQQAAAKHLQDVQASQSQKLQDIAMKSAARIYAFRQLKAAAP